MKKLLLSLFISFVLFISFGYCTYNLYSSTVFYVQPGSSIDFPYYGLNCIEFLSSSCLSNAQLLDSDGSLVNGVAISQMLCFNGTGKYINNYTSRCSVTLRGVSIPTCPTCPTCDPQYTSSECQNIYDLVPSSDLSTCQSSLSSCNSDLQSCQSSLSGRNNTLNNCSNNLLSCESSLASCIQSNCPIDTGDVMWSSLWINGIQHLGKPVINVSIPDNIYWDYITNDESFDLYVGSGYDQEYIDGIISINSYSPTSEDFTSIFVSGLTLIMPYIIFALFIVFLWKLIKRIFK